MLKNKTNLIKSLAAGALLFAGTSASVYAQQKMVTPPVVKCATAIPDQQWEDWMQEKVNELNQQRIIQGTNNVMVNYTIPVIFHIIHNQATITQENISAAQVASQITVLNNDYAGTNADIGSVPATFTSVKAGNTGVQFCLAKVDPTGAVLAEDGIERIRWSTRGWTDPNSFTTSGALQTYFDGTIKPNSIWDPTKYLNIWVAKVNGSGLLGYASFPAGTGLAGLTGVETATTCGVVLNQSATGTTGTAAAPYNGGRTATHEIGHWLGLRHIWGDGSCATDYCADTPPASTSNFTCQTHPYNVGVCAGNTTGEMFMNYMDYVDDACMYMFTLNQGTRIQTAMANGTYRAPLASSTKCNSPFALDAAITSILSPTSGMSTCNNSVTPQIILSNNGTTTLTSATITYNMDGGTNTVLPWTGSLVAGATATLTLNVYSGLSAAAHTFSVTVSAPNGGADGFAGNNTLTAPFTVIAAPAGTALPFTEGFEAVTFAPTGWSYTAVDPTNKWARVAHTFGLTAGSTAVAKMDNWSTGTIDPTGQRDALQTPPISFAAANSTLQVQFDVSHKMYNTTYIDSLNVWISTDCGGTWTKVYNKGGATLATVTPASTAAYTPTANGNWRRETVSLSSYAGQPVVYLKFESVSGWGNNLYLDNINISYTPSALPPVANFTAAATKCEGQAIAFTDASTNTPTSWAWTTNPTVGVTISNASAQNPNITFTTAGTYTVSLISTNANGSSPSYTQAVVVNALPTATAANNGPVCVGSLLTLTGGNNGMSTYSWAGPSAYVNATQSPTVSAAATAGMAGTYTITITDGNGCQRTATTAVTVNALPTATAANNGPVCAGNPLTLTGGNNGMTTYSWAGPSAYANATQSPTVSATATAGMAGTYTITITDGNGCQRTATTAVTVNALPTATAANNGPVCVGSPLTLTGGNNGMTSYSWAGPSAYANATQSPTVSATATAGMAGTYTITITDGNGCQRTATTAVTVNALPTATASNSGPVCAGSPLTLTGGNNGMTSYSWTGPGAYANGTQSPTVSATATAGMAGTYTLTISNGTCSNTATTAVTVNALPTATAANNGPVCVGNPLTLTGGNNGMTTYSWAGPNAYSSTSQSPTVSAAATAAMLGTYTLTITAANGCQRTATTAVMVNALPVASATNNSPVCAGSSLSLTGGNNGMTTYSWSGPNAYSSGTQSPTVSASATAAMAGAYTLTVTNANGCVQTATTAVTVNALPTVTATSSPVSGTVCAGTQVTLTGGGATTYTWTGGATNGVAFTPAGTLTYTVTGTGANGCTNTATKLITVNALPTVTATSSPVSGAVCAGSTLTLTGGGATSYTWTGGVTNGVAFTPASSGTYTVTGTDANGCQNTATKAITVNSLPTVTASSAPVSGTVCAGTQVTLTGGGATSYTWSGGVTDGVAFTPAGTLTYTVTGTDGNGCQNTATKSITVNSLPTVTATANPLSGAVCTGSQITLTGGGATSYTWSGGVINATAFTPGASATYTVTGTDANGCSNTTIQTVTVNSLPTVTVNSPSTCSGVATTLTAGGASAYLWSTTETTGSISVSPTSSTSYTVTGTDANGCENTAVANVTVTSAPNVTVNSMTICSGQSATLTGNGATSFSWNTGDVTASITVNPTGTTSYTVTGSNGPGCQNTAVATVTVNTPPTVSTNSSASTTVCSGIAVTLTATGASTYSWNTGDLTDIITVNPSATTTYTATGTDANGCSNTSSITVNVFPVNTPTVSQTGNTLTASGAVSYQWYLDGNLMPGETNSTLTATQNGTYTVETVDANGCTATSAGVVVSGIGIKEASALNTQVVVYPNPNMGVFSVTALLNNKTEYTTQFTNVLGEVLYKEVIRNTAEFKKEFSDKTLKTGVYFFIIRSTEGASSVTKVIIE
ncbi:MAG: M43 family zinc metalloprotease [Bacteroidota bacterium]|nr:M43 family zinc metalloprotease [Bacteroidota bacterium]